MIKKLLTGLISLEPIYNLSPVSEDDSYSQKAQSDPDNNIDPKDSDSSENPDAVEDYFTDASNADDNGTAGHRDSVLDESADLVGIGRRSDPNSDGYSNSLYFDFGIDNGAAHMKHTGISYLCGSVFPLADAKEAHTGHSRFIIDLILMKENIIQHLILKFMMILLMKMSQLVM